MASDQCSPADRTLFRFSNTSNVSSKKGTAAITASVYSDCQQSIWSAIRRLIRTIESDPYLLGMNLFTPAAIAASITTPWSLRAMMGSILITASWSLKTSVSEPKLKSLFAILVPVGNFADEVPRVTTVTLKLDLRSCGSTNAPRSQLAWTLCQLDQEPGRRRVFNIGGHLVNGG